MSLRTLTVAAMLVANLGVLSWQLLHTRRPPVTPPGASAEQRGQGSDDAPAATRRASAGNCPELLQSATLDERRAWAALLDAAPPQEVLALTPRDDRTRDRVQTIVRTALGPILGPELDGAQVECSRYACRVSVLHAFKVEPRAWQESLQRNPELRALGARFAVLGAPRVLTSGGGGQLLTELYLASNRLSPDEIH
jgi:hypothetical protein